MSGELAVPRFEALLTDLRLIREKGLGKLRHYRVPALHAAARICDLTTEQQQQPAAIEGLLRLALAELAGGTEADAAEADLGLAQGTKLLPSGVRRSKAAAIYGFSVDHFRKHYELSLFEQVAEAVLTVCREGQLRQTRTQMEQRHPADSRLAVQWVERFEAYYRIWTPVYALAANLEAAVSTRRDEPAEHAPWDPNSTEFYDPEDQADGYGRYALYAYTKFQLEVKRFGTRYGGLWLLSDVEVEGQVVDAVYRIGWHNCLNEDDDSWLRRFLADSRHEEPQHFAQMLRATSIGSQTLQEWQQHVAGCDCAAVEQGEEGCQVHATIRACRDYCDLIDQDWLKIADWYRPGSTPRRGISGAMLYGELLRNQRSGKGDAGQERGRPPA
jgi:hypothetical protein